MTDDQKLGPPLVEPMSDVSWARVERGLWSRVDSGATSSRPEAPRRRRVWLAAPSLAVAAIVAILVGAGVFSAREEAPVVAALDPSEPSRVVAGASPSAVSFGDAHIDLAAQSAIVMSREGGSPSVLLEHGVASFAVAPRVDRAPFVVRAGDTVVRVVGTRFSVSRSSELIRVAVEHGLVDVQFRGITQRVGAGETWSSEAPREVAVHTAAVTTPDETSDPVIATPRKPVRPRPATVIEGTAAERSTGSAAVPSTGSGAPSVTAPPNAATDTDRATYEQLTALEQRNSKAALAGYLELSRGHSQWAAIALFAAGRLATDLGDRRAATFLDIYLRRFPHGANADDARNLLARLKGDAP